jgi:serine/threonine-protein kinase
MAEDESAIVPPGCPGRANLDAFVRGQLPPEQLEVIAEHLSACSQCESSLEALYGEQTILAHLRRQPACEFPLDDPICGQLEDRARAIALEQPVAPTVTDGAAADSAADEGVGPHLPLSFGAYQLLARLGQGGMGIVYLARQEKLKRLVALKMVRAGVYASSEERMRFEREGEAIARVHHAHVVQIYEFGEHQGQLFFTMELLEGGTLARKLQGKPLAEREAAKLVRTLARAVHAAHDQGVVHRDLKPANVLFATDGTVKITDFGLAKVLDGENSDTRSDAILGTPSYMAPEQARGDIRAVSAAADVYALGAILYETLTGRPPFRAETRYQTLEQVRTAEPEAPSQLRPGLSRDLEAICRICLEKEPARRYESAEALADDLDRWLGGASTRARPLRWHHRVQRALRRHRGAVAAVGLLLALAAILLATFYFRDPERKMEDIQARLRHGEAVTLIGDKGDPAWSRWGLREGPADLLHAKDGAFVIKALDPAVLTLLDDPRGNYRFSAEVRHDDTARLGQVGICFAHSRHPTPRGLQQAFCTLMFNDYEAFSNDPVTGKKSSRLRLTVQRAAETGPGGIHLEVLKYFVPAAEETPTQLPWRRLAVEVRPEGLELFWEAERVAHFTHEQLLEMFDSVRGVWIQGKKVFEFNDLRPAFGPRDSLGLFVHRGGASYRRVRVEPLPPP